MSNFFGFPKPRKAGFGSPDIPSGDVPLETADEDVVLEGVIVDFGDADPMADLAGRKINLGDLPGGILDPFSDVHAGGGSEDIKSFLRRMMGADVAETKKDDFSGTFLVNSEDEEPAESAPEPTVDSAESVEDMLDAMGGENEKLQNFIADAMKNIKR